MSKEEKKEDILERIKKTHSQIKTVFSSINDKIGKANNSSDIEEIKETEKEIKNVLSNINKQI